MNKETCINCSHCKLCKMLNCDKHEWEWIYICNLFENEKDGWCLYLGTKEEVAKGNELCECWEEKK